MRRMFGVLAAMVVAVVGLIGVAALPAAAADVSKSITPNATPLTVTTTNPGDNIRVRFQGVTGQVISVVTSLGTFPTNCAASLTLRNPAGLALAGPVCAGQAGGLLDFTIPSSGIYQAYLDTNDVPTPLTGSVRVAVLSSTAFGAVQSITPNAPSVSVSVPSGGTVDLAFQGSAGKYVAVKGTGFADCLSKFQVIKPDATPLHSVQCAPAGAGNFTDQMQMTTSGLYKLRLTNGSGVTRKTKVQLWINADKTAPIVIDGAPVTTANLAVGQNQNLTFSGTSGSAITVSLSASTISSYCVEVRRPNGSLVVEPCFTAATGFVDTVNLDATGTWSLYVNPTVTATGKVTVDLNSTGGGTGTITIDGPAKTATIPTVGGTLEWTFSATSGTKLVVFTSASTISNGELDFYRPDGVFVFSRTFNTSDRFNDPIVLAATGTWKVVVDPSGTATGSVTVRLASAPDVNAGSLTLGTAKTFTTTKPGQLARATFTGTTGQRISVKTSAVTYDSHACVYFYRPNGSYALSGGCGYKPGGHFQDPVKLDATGTWTVEIDPYQDNVGSITVLLRDTPDVNAGAITLGTAKTFSTTLPGQLTRATFSGTTGQKISVKTSAVTYDSHACVYFYRPNGSYALSGGCGYKPDGHFQDPVKLDATGTWTVEIDPYDENVGSITVLLRDTPDVNLGTFTLGTAKTVTTTLPGQLARGTFSGTTGQRVSVKTSVVTFDSHACVYFYRPNGSYAFSGGCGYKPGGHFQDPVALDATGTWTVEVDPYDDNVGGMSLLLSTVTDLSGTVTRGGPAVVVTFTQPGQRGEYTMAGTSGQTIRIRVTGSTIAGYVELYNPSGGYVTACRVLAGTTDCGTRTLTATGTWKLLVDPDDDLVGTLNLAVLTS